MNTSAAILILGLRQCKIYIFAGNFIIDLYCPLSIAHDKGPQFFFIGNLKQTKYEERQIMGHSSF
jgi:hypothetical protein